MTLTANRQQVTIAYLVSKGRRATLSEYLALIPPMDIYATMDPGDIDIAMAGIEPDLKQFNERTVSFWVQSNQIASETREMQPIALTQVTTTAIKRWRLRGLPFELACRKVRADTERLLTPSRKQEGE